MKQWTPEAVRDLRRRLGLTQTQFAARLGCSIQAVQHWEHGLRTPTGLYAAALDRLAQETEQRPGA